MSTPNLGSGRARTSLSSIPRGESIASFDDYLDAQAAIGKLAHADFPVKQLSIIGNDLHSVERVTARLSYGRAALFGSIGGLWLGVFFGLFLTVLSPDVVNFSSLFATVFIGAGFGMLFGIVNYSITRRRKDYSSVIQVLASSYSIIVAPELAHKARNILEGNSTS